MFAKTFIFFFSFQMSHLYSMFAKQVSTYCKTSADSSIAKCKMELLTHGLRKLQEMNESHLDTMDPYQRGANDISKYLFIEKNKLDFITEKNTNEM
jgi:hypothetical protein